MNDTIERTIYFLELYFTPEPWFNEVTDKQLKSFMVKVVLAPLRTSEGTLSVTHADVFAVDGHIPKRPTSRASRVNLIMAIRDALEKRTGESVDIFNQDVIIFGGQQL